MLLWVVILSLLEVSCGSFVLDKTRLNRTYDGLGGLSGGGATTRLLVDYKEPQRSEILDYLFKPNFGASLQILKVEIGGDSQSTDGTETSHMHSKDDLDLKRGYEWWLMSEAKKRNSEIKLYGLPWAYPGWVGNDPTTGKPSGSPFTYPNQTSHYIMEWISGAKKEYGLDIDFIGIWNERSSDAKYANSLRQTLDAAGFSKTKIVAKDGGADICTAMAKDPAYAKTVDIIGLHYPSDYKDYSVCHSFGKPVWASEESSSYDDLNGAACWARVVNSHFVLSGMTSSIMWNLVGAYYHGTNWYASSMLTSVQPWSGHYEELPVVWATAHVTQFTKIGWKYLENNHGSGQLPKGGFFTTIVDPKGKDFTLQVVKISYDHAPCTRPKLPSFDVKAENVTFVLDKSMGDIDSLTVWRSNFEQERIILFEKQQDITLKDRSFTLFVLVGDFFTISTVRTAVHGSHGKPPPSIPEFPLPFKDDFNSYSESSEAKYFADQIGAFEIHTDRENKTNKIMRQMVPQLPIGWSDHGSNGPMTLIGMREWQDITIKTDFNLPISEASACVGSRVDQMWRNGLVVCVGSDGNWNLTIGGPPQNGKWVTKPILSGSTEAPGVNKWHTLQLTTIDTKASASVNDHVLFTNHAIRNLDTGFAAIGTNEWFSFEFDNVEINQAGNNWNPKSPCGSAKVSTKLGVRKCQANGMSVADLSFTLMSNWQIQHIPSGLCVTATSSATDSSLTLQPCNFQSNLQKFKNDYTRIRNTVRPMTLVETNLLLAGNTAGKLSIQKSGSSGWWTTWSYFPNTNQLRNQYVANTKLGYPMCLTTCGDM